MERIDSGKVMKVGMKGYKEIVDINWHGLIIHIKTLLSRREEEELIFSILECCRLGDKDELLYEFLDLSIRANIVAFYTDVELPLDINEQHKLLYYSDIFDVVAKNANSDQIDAVINIVKFYFSIR